MSIRQILVPIVGIGDAQRLLQNAFSIAARFKAHVVVCDTVPTDYPYVDPTGMMVGQVYEDLTKQLLKQQDQMRTAARHQFESAASNFGIRISEIPQIDHATATWISGADFRSVVWALGRLADLIIARRPVGNGLLDKEIVETALFSNRRPVLLVPSKAAHLDHGAAIAWNGSLEAATALQRSLEILSNERPVTVIQVGDIKPGGLEARAAVAYLECHGFKASAKFVPDAPKATTEILLNPHSPSKSLILLSGSQYFRYKSWC